MITAANKNVACKPVENSRNMGHKTKQGGIMVPDQITNLIETEVVFGNAEYPAGSTVFLAPSAGFSPWGQKVYTVGADKFILVPESEILLKKQAVATAGVTPQLPKSYKDWEEFVKKMNEYRPPLDMNPPPFNPYPPYPVPNETWIGPSTTLTGISFKVPDKDLIKSDPVG